MTDVSKELAQPLTVLDGVGPVRARRLAQLGLHSLRDVLVLVPRGLERQGACVSVEEARAALGRDVSVVGKLSAPRIFRRGRRTTVSVDVCDDTGKIRAHFFGQGWMFKRLKELAVERVEVELYGRVGETPQGPALTAPRIATDEKPLPTPGTTSPIYALTEGVGLDFLRGLTRRVAEEFAGRIRDPLPADALAPFELPELGRALAELHAPASEESFLLARRRLSLEKLLIMQAALERSRARTARGSARAIALKGSELRARVDALPHSPTEAQRGALRDIARDLARTRPMRRLLQGDVGSGKTLVALGAVSFATASGGQAAFLVPTEILAEQHFLSLGPALERAGIRAVLLTGSLAGPERRRVLAELASGAAQLVVGTHALVSTQVRFASLDLAIVDEQQRFGVELKRSLLAKGRDVHTLLLTATPIPRTLALAVYGDLDVSVLDHKPRGRGVLKTHFVEAEKRARMLGFVRERLDAGELVFWVCPRISSDDADGGDEDAPSIAAAEDAYRALSTGPLGRHGAELLHGRMPADERSACIARFRNGDARLLVSTSIVEVGVDVEDATVMVIEGAERFGLAQLHQLRGRVGRGARPSWCFLLGSPAAEERLRVLEDESDGFRIAEEDLRQRGMGDLAGLRQAGKNVEGLDDPVTDLELILHARELVQRDAELCARYASYAPMRAPALV